MKVFISSVIRDFEEYRDAVDVAINTLTHVPVRAERFEASPNSPQQSCLERVRKSDVLILILGERYGTPQPNGLSATHEEYNEAVRLSIPVLVFLEDNITPDYRQAQFIEEIQSWLSGRLSEPFRTTSELERKAIRALYSLEPRQSLSPSDEHSALQRALARINEIDEASLSQPQLVISTASSPTQSILRPSELEGNDLTERIKAEATAGRFPLFHASEGIETAFQGDALSISASQGSYSDSLQPVPYIVPISGTRRSRRRRLRLDSSPLGESRDASHDSDSDSSRSILTDERGSVRITRSAIRSSRRSNHQIQSLIEKDLLDDIFMSLGLVERILHRIDIDRRLTRVAIVAGILGPKHHPWRTREEHELSPYSATLNWSVSNDPIVVHLDPAVTDRTDLKGESTMEIAKDLMVLLRRRLRDGNQI